jgi:hypothetical protein
MAKAMPVGTIRQWEQGFVIKASDSTLFSSGWIPLETSPEFEELGSRLDGLARNILNKKIPIDGELYLDHEIEEFQEDGENIFQPDDFKKYEGFSGAGRYSFRNEFSRRFMARKIALHDAIQAAFEQANDSDSKDTLTKEQKAEIRTRVREDFKNNDPPFTIETANKLGSIVERVHDHLKQGLTFEGKDKEVYEKAVSIIESLPEKYERISVKKKQKKEAIEMINEQFKDNWAVRESFKKKADEEYQDYMRKFRKNIFDDEVEDQQKTFGVKLNAPTEQFYKKLYSTLAKAKNKDDYPFAELLEIRFAVMYQKELVGDWQAEILPAIEIIEKQLHELPSGHFYTNKSLQSIRHSDRSSEGYAHYNPRDRQIMLSANLTSQSDSLWSKFDGSDHFKNVLLHEIGHAVSMKLGGWNSMNYKQFVKHCGWSWNQDELRHGKYQNTGDNPDQIREGSYSHISLLTKYAHKSPEEAFAEYYSFYATHKKEIDRWFDKGDIKALEKSESYKANTKEAGVWDASRKYKLEVQQGIEDKIQKEIKKLNLDKKKFIEMDLISPWELDGKPYDAPSVRSWKDNSPHQMPIVVVKCKDKKAQIISSDGENIQMASKIGKQMQACITVKEELYSQLKGKGFTDSEIVQYASHTQDGKSIPTQSSKPESISGLMYDYDIIPVKEILRNELPLRWMRKIYESDELKKALDELFGTEENDIEKGGKAYIGEKRTWQGKTYKKQLDGSWKEVNEHEQENKPNSPTLDHLKQLTSFVSGRQRDYFNWQLENAEDITIEKLPQEIKEKLPKKLFEVKQCYVNAYKVCSQIREAKYVEGMASIHGIPIDHAWVEINGKHYDPTNEFVFDNESKLTDYVAIQKYDQSILMMLANRTGEYGPYLQEMFRSLQDDKE